jgi:hypothetical protein
MTTAAAPYVQPHQQAAAYITAHISCCYSWLAQHTLQRHKTLHMHLLLLR